MDVKALRSAGWTIRQIADHLGYHPATVSEWLKNGGPPAKREFGGELVVDERWAGRIGQLLERNGALQGTSIMRVISAEGFPGSYQSLTRHLRGVRGPTRGKETVVTVPIETGPAEEFQFDWSDCNPWARRWGWDHELHCFGAVLCWCRKKFWWFTDSIDQPHTLEGLALFFEEVGGVCGLGRTDRMGQLGQARGKAFRWHPVVLEFARHYGFAFKACQKGDAARKGKIERPFRDLKGGFLAEMDLDPPADVGELNRRVGPWLERYVHAVTHRVTKVPPAERFAVEGRLLFCLPRMRFDTARREARHVGRTCLLEWDGVFYSAPPEVAGLVVEARQAVDSAILELRFGGRLIAEHRIVTNATGPVWLPEHKAAAEVIALSRHDRHLRPVDEKVGLTASFDLGEGDYDVEEPDLDAFSAIGPHPGAEPPVDIASDRLSEPDLRGRGHLGGAR